MKRSIAFRPYDLAMEFLRERLPSTDRDNPIQLDRAGIFKSAMQTFEAVSGTAVPLERLVSSELTQKANSAIEWLSQIAERLTGKKLTFIAPLTVDMPESLGRFKSPLILIQKEMVESYLSAKSMSELKQLNKEARAKDPRHRGIDITESRESMELQILSAIVHEGSHATMGYLRSPSSPRTLRSGLSFVAFNSPSNLATFSVLTEATAILTEYRFFIEQEGLTPDSNWYTTATLPTAPNEDLATRIEEYRNLFKTPSTDENTSRYADFIGILRLTHMLAADSMKSLTANMIHMRFSDNSRGIFTGYKLILKPLELLAAEIYRNEAQDHPDAVRLLHEELLRSKIEADPKRLLKLISKLAENDRIADKSSSDYSANQVAREYIYLFSRLRPNTTFDCLVLHAFAKAGSFLPADQALETRLNLIKIFREATHGISMHPYINAY